MGVSGCGKSTVGNLLATRLECRFADADDFHSTENVARMSAGIPLTDEDRAGWLERLRREIKNCLDAGESLVLACSALRETYRERLAGQEPRVVFVYLKGTFEQVADRLAERREHFMPQSLLRSQFATLEEPAQAIVVPVDLKPDEAVAQILRTVAANNSRIN